MQRPNSSLALGHVALFIKNFSDCVYFYKELLGMKVDWQPDEDNIYFTTGFDNLALHRAPEDFIPNKHQRLDHLGFMLKTRHDVDEWCEFLKKNGVEIKAQPKNHRDGTRSFYCADPDGNVVQFIYFPVNDA